MQQGIATTRSIDGGDGAAITVGLDVGDRYTHVHALGAGGEVLREQRIRTTALAVGGALGDLPPARVVIEAGPRSPWLSRVVADLGHEVVVANPRQVALIARSQRKTDRLGAAWLARLGRFDPELLAPIRHRSERSQHDLAVVRARDALVRTRTLLINHVRGAVKACGAALPSCTAGAFHRKAAEHIPGGLRPALLPLVEAVGELTARIAAAGREVEALCEAHPETRALRQVTGVGPITALTFVLTIEDPGRFPRTGRWGPTSDSCRGSASLESARHSSGSARAATRACGDCWCRPRTTSSAPSGPTPTCAAGVSATREQGRATRRSARSWPSRGGWRCCCSRCGRAGRPTSRCVTPRPARPRRRAAPR